MKLFITGIGVVSAIGNDVTESLSSLLNDKHGIKWSEDHNMMLGQVSLTNDELVSKLELTGQKISRTVLLGLVAAKEAWGNNKIDDSIKTGIISSTSVGGLDISEYYFKKYKQDQKADYSKFMVQENGKTTEEIAEILGIKGYINTLSTACSSGANAILLGARLIRSGRLDRVLVGGIDPIAEHNLKGFSALNIVDNELCKPFDLNRKGLNLGEGAGFLLIESEKSIERSKNAILCELSGWNNASDNYHQTASSPDGKGATLTMENALKVSNLSAEEISYVNVHGTGTINNDESEAQALKNVFTNKVPPFSSTKTFTGHTLAASGAIEAVFSVLTITEQFMPNNLRFEQESAQSGLIPLQQMKHTEVKHVISNSFGFGGNCSSLIFSKID
ncbi:MAG: hypothetical protein RI883_1476 [Bacteroidota bacterium]|jgi:3-oxoacyl-[acyl-carrier-protein] synthase-1